jgi:hypothetical protein
VIVCTLFSNNGKFLNNLAVVIQHFILNGNVTECMYIGIHIFRS